MAVALASVVLVSLALVAAARAEGKPDITATISSSSTLYGNKIQVRATASNPQGQPYGYNLSYRVVLPAGVEYAGGGPVAPRQLAGAPGAGETTLIFANVSDLSPGSTGELPFELDYDRTTYDAGASFPVKLQAFVNEHARYVPKFDAEGRAKDEPTSYTGSTPELTGTQTLKPLEVEIEEPSKEGEILRGVHEHQTVYTVKVRNNGVNPTTGSELDVFVPAGLEFLGCAGTPDHTTDAPTNTGSKEEWPGSGPIVVEAVADCTQPQSVQTEELDPDGAGPLPFGVYTHVVWPVGNLTKGQTKVFAYRAAVPIKANTNTFTGPRPSAESGGQASNLDNNGGPEVVDETVLHTYAVGTGTYEGATSFTAKDDETLDRTAEDWVVHKSASSDALAQGQITTWKLLFETSEYKFVEGATVEDTLPDGLCPLGPENFTPGNDPADEECDPVGEDPSAEYASASENPDGSWTLTWDEASLPKLGHTGISDKFEITFPTLTRTHYQENGEPAGPVLAHDRIENGVTTEGAGFARCTAPGTPDCSTPGPKIDFDGTDGATIEDASHAAQEAGAPKLLKEVAQAGTDCQTATYTTAVPHYHPGDRVCWRLRVDFPGTLDTSPQALADFLPEGAEYLAGSDETGPQNNVIATVDPADAGEGFLTWTVSGSTVPAGGEVFEHFIVSTARPTGIVQTGDLTGNLFKFSSENTEKETFPQRAEAEYVLDTPAVDLVKGVETVVRGGNTIVGPEGENHDHVQVEAGDEVTYRVDLKNTGGQDAANVEVWDQLPAEYDCTAISEISNGGSCVQNGESDRIVWTVPSLEAEGGAQTLTYAARVPSDIGPGRTLTNTAGVRQFEGETNTGGSFTYTPAENIDPEDTTEPNAPAADDPSDVYTAAAAVAKTATTSANEGGNDAAGQATIGETITYKLTAEVPEGTTLGGTAELTDAVNSVERQPYVPGSATASLNGSALPAGFELDDSGATPKVVFPAGYSNPAGSGQVDKVVLEFEVVVANVVGNVRGSSLTDQGTLSWVDPSVGPRSAESPTLTTTVVEPLISQEKTDDKSPSRVHPGDVVTYTLTTANSAAANVSTAHEVTIEDVVPVGLTPVKAAGEALADEEEVPGSGGAVWHAAARTITKTVATVAPGANSSFSYKAEVDNPAIGGAQLTNVVESTTASLGGTAADRRTSGSGYEAEAEDTVRIGGATIEKAVTPEEGTPGDPLTYRLTVTIPPHVALFDTTVTDVLPAGVEFDAYGTSKCLSGCPLVNPVNEYEPALDSATGKKTIAWDLGDIPSLAAPQEVEFTYTAHLLAEDRAGNEVADEDTEVNAATVNSNLTDKNGAFDKEEIPTGFDETSPEATTTTSVVEPELTIEKKISVGGGSFGDGPTVAHSDEGLTYRLIVKNEGTSPAYDVELTDVSDPAVINVALVPQAGVTVKSPWSAATHEMELEVAGPIAPEDSETIEYTAEFVAASQLSDGQQVVNAAALPLYFGVAKVEREANPTWEFREYEGGEDSAEAVLDFPGFTLEKTTGLAGNPDTGYAEVNQSFPWRIVVANTSATAGATAVHVVDTLPPNWTYEAGSTEFDGTAADNPTITTDPAGDTLEWTIGTLPKESSVTITFGAKPSLAAATTPGTGPEANVNAAEVTAATDEAGNSGNAEGPYGTAPDTATATLLTPELELEKKPDLGVAVAGDGSSFTIEVTNHGLGTARNLDVEDVLPAGLGYTAGEATASPPAGFGETAVETDHPGSGETTVHWHLDELGAEDSVTITMPVTVAADVADGTTLTNHAVVTSEELPTPDPEAEDDGSLEVGAEADMTIVKTGEPTYTAGNQYVWHLQVKNLGPSDAQGVAVTDPLPAGVTFVAATAPCEPSGTEVKCALGTAAAGFDKTYDVTVDVAPGTDSSPLENTATVSTTTSEPAGGQPNSSTFGPTPSPLADVWVKKSAQPGLILKSQETEFTIEVGNDGPSTARAVTLSDPLPAGQLELVSTAAPCTGAGNAVSCGFGDLAPGETRTAHVKAKGIADGEWENTATVATTTPQPTTPAAEENDEASAQVIVGAVVDMTIDKTGPATVAAGGRLTWTIDVRNDGPDDATGVEVEDTLPGGVQFVSADPGCSEAGGKVTCDLGDMAFGDSLERHITVAVPTALADQILVNTATVEADEGELEKENNDSEAKTTVGPAADLAITKTGPAKVAADGVVTWTLVATNHGPSTATGVKVEDTLPAGVELRGAQPSQGSCGGSVSCALGTLAKGASARIVVSAHVPASLGGRRLTNSATVSGEQPDPNPGDNSDSATTEVEPKPSTPPPAVAPRGFNLSLKKKLIKPSRPRRGDVLTYRLTVRNEGPATARRVKVRDELPAALEYVSGSLSHGKCAAKRAAVTCKLGSLAGGVKKTVTLRARAVGGGKIKNTASVSAAGTDRKPADDDDAAVAHVRAGGNALQLTKKRRGPGLVEAGKKVRFLIKVKNPGRIAAIDVVVCDRLPRAMSFVKVRKAKFKHGNACWQIDRLGGHRSRRYTVVARVARGIGDRKLRNVATVKADGTPRRHAAASVRVESSGPGREGGVTG